jgi:hypothetical protein
MAAVRVEGLRELQRSFGQIQTGLRRDLRTQLKAAAEPARTRAEGLAFTIRNMTGPWSRMRIGVTASAVYLAPKSKRRGGSPRPNFKLLLLRDSMLPAAEETMPEVRERLGLWLDALGGESGF